MLEVKKKKREREALRAERGLETRNRERWTTFPPPLWRSLSTLNSLPGFLQGQVVCGPITIFHRNIGEKVFSLPSISRVWAAFYKGDWERVRRNIPAWTILTVFLCAAIESFPWPFTCGAVLWDGDLIHTNRPDLLSNEGKKSEWRNTSAFTAHQVTRTITAHSHFINIKHYDLNIKMQAELKKKKWMSLNDYMLFCLLRIFCEWYFGGET